MSDFNVFVPDLESIPESDINDRRIPDIVIEIPINPVLIGPAEESDHHADEWVNSLITENSSLSIENQQLKIQLEQKQADIENLLKAINISKDLVSTQGDRIERLENILSESIHKSIVEQKELEFKTLQDNLNIITQSFNVCRSMLIHIGSAMGEMETYRAYIKSLVDSPAIQEHIGG